MVYFLKGKGIPQKVKKGWGHELIFANERGYCGKLLVFRHAGYHFSMHFHMNKTETWYVLKGKFSLQTLDPNTADRACVELEEGDTWTNEPGRAHKLIALETNATIIEVSTYDNADDNYRIEKGMSQDVPPTD